MLQSILREIIIDTTRKTLPRQSEAGNVPGVTNDWWLVHSWAVAYSEPAEGNPFHKNQQLRDAIIRFGDYNASQVTDDGAFATGEVDWRFFSWFEGMELIRGELGEKRQAAWRDKMILGAEHVMRASTDMDTFDGLVPNHGIWAHAMLYRIGQLFDRREFREMASYSLSRDFGAQTADGCFREGGTAAGMPGTPVTAYNIVSANAIEQYHHHSGDPLAVEALEKAWRWWLDFLLPDYTSPPNLDFRQPYHDRPHAGIPACWANKPEGRHIVLPVWEDMKRKALSSSVENVHALGFFSLKYALYRDDVQPREPKLGEYNRMAAGEACVRRREPWAVSLSGMTNLARSTHGLRLWAQERQDCVALYHRDTGLIIGSANGLIQEELSTFVFYEAGNATYLHNDAYLKSTPPLDTLLLRYGHNAAAVSVDTNDPAAAKIIFSLHGERGRRTERGAGHPLSAMAAKAHLALRAKPGDVVTLAGESWTLADDPRHVLKLRVEADQELDLGRWSISCADGFWEFRWPVRTLSAYTLFDGHAEQLGLLEVVLYDQVLSRGSFRGPYHRPTAIFNVKVNA